MDMPTDPEARPLLIFDGDCGFCTSSVRWLAGKLVARQRTTVTTTPYQWLDLAALGVTEQRAAREVLWVNEAGRVTGGAQAFACWLQRDRGAWAVLGRVLQAPLVRPLAALVYRLVASNRHRLPGGTPACAVRPPS